MTESICIVSFSFKMRAGIPIFQRLVRHAILTATYMHFSVEGLLECSPCAGRSNVRFALADEEGDEDDDELTEVSSVDGAGSLGSELGPGDASLGPPRARRPAETASVASTWRPERTDRNPNLSFIDERSATFSCPHVTTVSLAEQLYSEPSASVWAVQM